MRTWMLDEIRADYEDDQLIPIEGFTDDPDDPNDSRVEYQDLVDKLPESANVEMRMAVFEAIVDDMVEDIVGAAESDEKIITESEVEEQIEPFVDKVVELRLVSGRVRKRIPALIRYHLRRKDPRSRLAAKAAFFMTHNLTRMEDALDPVITDDTVGTDHGTQTGDVTYGDHAEVDPVLPDNIVPKEPEAENVATVPSEVQVESGIPEGMAEAMRMLAAASANRRKGARLVARRVSEPFLRDTLHRLRYQLPETYRRKYHVQ